MKTKQLFITLISSILLTACSTDDSVLEPERATLESINHQSLIKVKNSICNYSGASYIYYSNSAKFSFFRSVRPNLSRISFLRENFISNELQSIGECPVFKIPENSNYIYDETRKQYYEIWESIYSAKPDSHEIEL